MSSSPPFPVGEKTSEEQLVSPANDPGIDPVPQSKETDPITSSSQAPDLKIGDKERPTHQQIHDKVEEMKGRLKAILDEEARTLAKFHSEQEEMNQEREKLIAALRNSQIVGQKLHDELLRVHEREVELEDKEQALIQRENAIALRESNVTFAGAMMTSLSNMIGASDMADYDELLQQMTDSDS